MKVLILLFLSICFLNLSAQKPMQYFKSKSSVSGVARETGENNKSVLMANTSFKIVKGKTYKGQAAISTFITDDKGNFFVELPVGTYCVVEKDRPEVFTEKKNTATEKWDNACLKKLWQTPLGVVEVKSNDAGTVEIFKQLSAENPCLKK